MIGHLRQALGQSTSGPDTQPAMPPETSTTHLSRGTKMNSIRKFLGLLFLMALALPATAQNEKRQYTINITSPSPATINAGTQNTAMTFAIANVSPDGISTIRSFRLAVPANSGIKIKSAPNAPSVGSPFTGSITVDPNGTFVTVENIQPPVKPFDPVTGTIRLTLYVDVPCTAAGGAWSAISYTGASLSGQQFNLAQPSSTTLTLSACTVSVTATANPAEGGTVTCSNHTTYGSTNASCTAAPAALWHLTGFTGDCLSTSGLTCTVSNPANPLISNKAVVANFAPNTLAISVPSKVVMDASFNVGVTADPSADVTLTSTCSFTGAGTKTGTSLTFSGSIADAGNCTLTASATGYPTATQTFKVYSGTVSCANPTNYVSSDPGVIDPDYAYLDLKAPGVGPQDYGIRRGPNSTSSPACSEVDVSLEFPNSPYEAHFTYTNPQNQAGSFKYMIVWGEVSVDASLDTTGWTNKRPKLAWVEDLAGKPVYVPALTCVDDDLSDPSTLMPLLPNVEPFKGTTGTPSNADYYVGDPDAAVKAGKYLAGGGNKAKMCVAQHGWMSTNLEGGVIKVIYWTKIVDQADAWAAIDQ
jgi:hypothetical protein